MAPKKSKKISLNEFLGDSSLGSWADEVDSLPNAPATRIDEEQTGDRFGRRDDFSFSRSDRQQPSFREDVPLPSQPPFTAFVGNLAFDLTDSELEDFFSYAKIKSAKIIKDKDDKPKGFGYVEFEELEDLKEALTKTGTNLSGRVIRVSVAEPPKERSGFGGGSDDTKFSNPWRRDGPLPHQDAPRRRTDGSSADKAPSGAADEINDWRSSGRPQRSSEPEFAQAQFKRKTSGFGNAEGSSAADKEDNWVIGSRFKPSTEESHDEGAPKFGSARPKGDMGPPQREPVSDEIDWRSSARSKPARSSVSPSNSTPPTPQLARRKLELLPRSGGASVTPSPLSSPKMGSTPPPGPARSNPFGAARPVDVSSREKEVSERLQREKESQSERHSMSRTSSRTGVDRNSTPRPSTNPSLTPPPPKAPTPKGPTPNLAPSVRSTLSFASAARKDSAGKSIVDVASSNGDHPDPEKVEQ
ncbi:hypothetical protein CPB83DRAFT_844416 [Crepidotus variabilis]|uniref:RRM domain-containing protein n=1 Tax=Crepidotus variabilis TaxID=179855 RepID=A0A9P6EPP5_9AGAR|nr:hypothetical protein CPB83DRAFT_844416 [Crepidotus variabilis]